MRTLTYDEFVVAWHTYWGRREIGFVLENSIANQIASPERSLRTYYEQWAASLEIFPDRKSFWLLGTPDLTPELLPPRPPTIVGPPPVTRIGPFATGHPSVYAQSQHAGDYKIPLPQNSEAARLGRRVARAQPGFIVSVLALIMFWAPYFSIPLALLGLTWTSQAHWALHRNTRETGLPLWFRGRLVVGQAAAALSIALAATIAIPQLLPTPPPPTGHVAMPQTAEGSLAGGIIDRLRQHWPEIEVTTAFEEGDLDSPTLVRVRVATDVYLDAVPGDIVWAARPMIAIAGEVVPIENNPAYSFGVTTNDGAELIADRFYEEVRFWWGKLHPEAAVNEQPA